MKDFNAFHEKYTVPLHGFSSIDDFFRESTCDRYLGRVEVPVFIGNAFNDPMLGQKCYPYQLASDHKNIFLEVPRVGGHVGFTLNKKPFSWMEKRAEEFIRESL